MIHKTCILSALAVLMVPLGLCWAQPAGDENLPPPPPGQRGPHGPRAGGEPPGGPKFMLNMYDRITRQLPDQLNLSLDQMDKYKTMVREHRKALEEIVKKLEQERTKFDSDLNAILTPEQQTKLKELKQDRERTLKGMQGGPGMGKARGAGEEGRQWILAKAIKELNLPAEKNAQVEKILAEGREKFQATPKGDREAHRQVMKQTMDSLRNALSPEEMNRLKTIMREEREKSGVGPGRGGKGRFGGPGNRPGRGPGGPEQVPPPPQAEEE